MALTLIKEDGTGMSDANAYASAADGDAYHEGHLYATAWSGATLANKEIALVMASRLIDAEYQFHGTRSVEGQALQWPRVDCPDLDGESGAVLESDAVPKAVVDATCEMARELITADRTAAPDGEGIAQIAIAGGFTLTFNKQDRRPVVSQLAQSFLAKLGWLVSRGCEVKLVRT